MKIKTAILLSLIPLMLSGKTPERALLPPSQTELSSPAVTQMVEDSEGNLWIGTYRGLNRYNGSSYRVYYQEESGLASDYINGLCADTEQRIWVGTPSGICLVREGKVVPEATIPVRMVEHIISHDDGHLMFSTREGLFLADKKTKEIQPVHLDSRLAYNEFLHVSDHHIWVRDLTSDTFTVLDPGYRILKEFRMEGGIIHDIAEGPDQSVYLCTRSGLLHFASDGTPIPVSDNLKRETDGKDVLFMVSNGEDSYIGIRGEGVFMVKGDSLTREWDQEDLAGVTQCTVLLTDDNLWISTNGQGFINLYRHLDRNSMPIPSDYPTDALNMFYSIGNGYMLVITNQGVFRQHLATGDWKAFQGDGLGGKDKLGITLRDRSGHFWIELNYNELRKYHIEGDRLSLEQAWPMEPTNSIWDDAAGNVFLLQGEAIHRFTQDGRRDVIQGGPHPDFWFCGQFTSGRPYFLSEDGIWFLDDNMRFYSSDLDIPDPTCIWEDPRGDWWIGTRSSGIFRRSGANGSIRSVRLDGADTSIRSISGDLKGNIWASTRFDFLRISGEEENVILLKNPEGGATLNNTNSVAVTENGTAVFGSRRAFFFFRETPIALNENIPLFLDGLIVNGKTYQGSIEGPIVLDHDSQQIAFYFSGRNFNPGMQPTYQYMLEGYDNGWVNAGQNLRAGYSSLESGKYTFRVRVQRPDGTWSGSELLQQVRIKPSPWFSWPMQLLYLLLLTGLGAFAIQQMIRFRVNREKLELTEQERALSEQISQERTTFFTNVSHEFRTPLSLIYGPVKELARSESLGDKERELVGIVERNSDRMVRLTDQLLHFSRSRDTLDSLSIMRTDLSVLLRKMLENFEYMFSQKDLRITTHIPSDLVVYCDREKVERIVFNLLSNAVKYTPAHGEITVSATSGDGKADITVADTGIGISPDKMNRIFERYERVRESVEGSLPTGFGIGLNYAQHLAHLHKGQIEVHANDPIGSVFSFSFPCGKEAYEASNIWHEEEEAKTPDIQAAAATEAKSIHILVVEDNHDMREYIKGFLREDYDVTIAGDGEEAWKCIRLSVPDLIISDVMMPYKDGYTLCKEIKTDPEYCHIPVILLTAKADMENQIHGLDLGADGYLGKPFDPSFLTALVRNLVAGRRRLQGLLADRTSSSEEPVEDAGLSQQDKAFLDKCYRIIDSHIDDEAFGVIGLSMEMGMSRTSIFSKIKALTGQSPQAFLTNYRLNRAMELLKTRDYNISEVAYKVGFATLTGFSRSFKNKFGVPPSAV